MAIIVADLPDASYLHLQVTSRPMVIKGEAYLDAITIVIAAATIVVELASAARPAFVKPLITSTYFTLPYLVVAVE